MIPLEYSFVIHASESMYQSIAFFSWVSVTLGFATYPLKISGLTLLFTLPVETGISKQMMLKSYAGSSKLFCLTSRQQSWLTSSHIQSRYWANFSASQRLIGSQSTSSYPSICRYASFLIMARSAIDLNIVMNYQALWIFLNEYYILMNPGWIQAASDGLDYFLIQVSNNFYMIQKQKESNYKENKEKDNLVILLPQNKRISFHIPRPCPVPVIKQAIAQSLDNYTNFANKIAYLQTVNADWLTDYKLQVGQGWLRSELRLQCIFKDDQYQKMAGLQAYEMLKCIGVGGFSKVYLCRDRRDGEFYAAKFMQKLKLQGKTELIINQREVNEQIAFPFLVQMKEFFQTEEYYIMILDYCPGGELFHLQKKVVRFTQEQAKKYFIEVLLAIQYLHNKNIVYRDLKPENIMIDLKGHVRIADFGLAKVSRQKRYSYCGSLEYMSPEIVGRIGHSFEVDYYCLGALLYEMVVGCPPFYCHNSSEVQTKSRIMYEEVEFPQEIGLSDSIKDLMRQLLVKDPSKRLGHLGGVKEIKCHAWIGWINKSDYLQKKLKMPYPVNLDCFNFDACDITQSANRMLYNLQYEKLHRNGRNTSQPKNKSKSKDKRSFSKKLSTRVINKRSVQKLSYKSTNSSLNKQKCLSGLNHSKERESQEKTMLKNGSFCIKTKKKHHNSQPTLKINRFQSIRNCYLGASNNNLNKFLRFPTESYDSHNQLIKQRRSYVKVDTENKQSQKNKEKQALKKRRAKQDYAFEKVKRKI